MIEKFVKKEYYTIDYSDFDDLVAEVYGVPYEFVATEEASNDSDYNYNVKKNNLSEYEQNELNGWRKGEKVNYITQDLLCDMCDKDLIPEGNYLISVCW